MMNNEEKDADKLKATKEAVEYYRKDVNANTIGMVIFLIGLPIAGVVLMEIYPEIWWFTVLIVGGVTMLSLVVYLYSNNVARKRLKKMEEELLEIEKKLAEDKENNEQYEKNTEGKNAYENKDKG